MYPKRFVLVNAIIFAGIIAYSQEIIVCSGDSMANSKVRGNWTIGEPITETVVGNNATVTSGFNQPILTISTSVENIKSNVVLSVYPNPASQFVNIKYDGELPIKVKISTLSGQYVFITEISEQPIKIDFSEYKNGIYLFEIMSKSEKSNMYRIVKQ